MVYVLYNIENTLSRLKMRVLNERHMWQAHHTTLTQITKNPPHDGLPPEPGACGHGDFRSITHARKYFERRKIAELEFVGHRYVSRYVQTIYSGSAHKNKSIRKNQTPAQTWHCGTSANVCIK